MKYKLKKDINWANAWTEFEYPHKLPYLWQEEELIKKEHILAELIGIDNTDYFEKIEEAGSIYDLKEGDKYYYIASSGEFIQNRYGNYVDQDLLNIWNAFMSQKEAEQELKKRKAIAKIKRWKYKNDMNVLTEQWYIWYWYSYEWDNWDLYIDEQEKKRLWEIYYSSEKKAAQALSELREQYNILFWIH